MNNKENHIEKMIEETLESVSQISRVNPRPYLYTRLMARMNRIKESGWERAGNLLFKPAIGIAGLCLIFCINVSVAALKYTTKISPSLAEPQLGTEDISTVASLYDIENTEP